MTVELNLHQKLHVRASMGQTKLVVQEINLLEGPEFLCSQRILYTKQVLGVFGLL